MDKITLKKLDDSNGESLFEWKNIRVSNKFKPEDFKFFVTPVVDEVDDQEDDQEDDGVEFLITNVGNSVFESPETEYSTIIYSLEDSGSFITDSEITWFVEYSKDGDVVLNTGNTIEVSSEGMDASTFLKIHAETTYKDKTIKSNELILYKISTTKPTVVSPDDVEFTISNVGVSVFQNEEEEESAKLIAYVKKDGEFLTNVKINWRVEYSKSGKKPVYNNRLYIQIFASDLLNDESVRVFANVEVNGKILKSNEISIVRAIGGSSTTAPDIDDEDFENDLRFIIKPKNGINSVNLFSLNTLTNSFISSEIEYEAINRFTNQKVLPVDGSPFTYEFPTSTFINTRIGNNGISRNINGLFSILQEIPSPDGVDVVVPFKNKFYTPVSDIQSDEKNEIKVRFWFYKIPPVNYEIQVQLKEVSEYSFFTPIIIPEPEQYLVSLTPSLEFVKNDSNQFHLTKIAELKLFSQNGNQLKSTVDKPIKLIFKNVNYFTQVYEGVNNAKDVLINSSKLFLGTNTGINQSLPQNPIFQAEGHTTLTYYNGNEIFLNVDGVAYIGFLHNEKPISDVNVEFEVEHDGGFYKKDYSFKISPPKNLPNSGNNR